MERNDVTFVPFSVDAFELYDAAINYTIAWCHAVLRSHANDDVVADLSILNQAGKLVACIEGFRLRPITRKTIAETLDAPSAVPSSSAPLTRPGIRRESSHSLADVNDLTDYIQAKCVEISGHPVAEISTDASFISLGFDSLVAMVLANHLRRDFGCSVAVTRILQSKSLRHLAQEIAQQNGESLFRM